MYEPAVLNAPTLVQYNWSILSRCECARDTGSRHMQVTLNAVRVYGSAAYRGTTPELQPAVLTIPVGAYVLDTAGTQGNATIYLGPPVPWIQEASRIRRAIGHFFLELFRGIPFPTDPDAAIAAAIAQPDAAAPWQDSWYVTLVLA